MTDAKLGLKYNQGLCRAIESFTNTIEADNREAFKYRGAHLKYAVERYLYFSFVTNKRLFSIYARCLEGKFPSIIYVASEIERDLALYLCGDSLPRDRIRVNRLYRIDVYALSRLILNLTKKMWYSLTLFARNSVFENKGKTEVLIYVIHEKFINYLRPLTDALPVPFAYLTAMAQELKPFLTKQGIPFVDSVGLFRPVLLKKPNGVLSRFWRLIVYYEQFYENLLYLKPKCVILVEGNSPQDEIMNQACKQLSIPTICMQQGWSPVIHSGFRNMSFTKMLVWGDGFSELLKQYNPRQYFTAVGNHMIVFPKGTNDPSGNKKGKGICFFLQVPNNLITGKDWNGLIRLIKWTAASFTDTPVLVREHPSYPLSQKCRAELRYFPNIRLMHPRSYSMSEVLGMSRVSVSIYSSALLESIAAGVVPVAYNIASLPSCFPDESFLRAGVEARSLIDAQGAIRDLLKDDLFIRECEPRMEEFRKKYFRFDRENAVRRIIDEITSLLN